MVNESYPWKRDLLKRKQLIEKYNRVEHLSECDNDRVYTTIEKSIFYSAFIIRKLIDCKAKVSDEVDNYKFTLKGFKPLTHMDLMHRWLDEKTHDWKLVSTYTVKGNEICNWLIHSFVFCLCYNENGRIDNFFVSSDKDKNKILYCVDLNDWIAYMDFVGHNYVVAIDMHYETDSGNEYKLTKKERGAIKEKNWGAEK